MKRLPNFTFITLLGTVALVAVVAFFAAQTLRLNTSYSIRQFFPVHHPLLTASHEMERNFQLRPNPSYLVTADIPANLEGSWLDESRFKLLEEMTAKLSKIENVQAVTSLSSIQIAADIGQEFRIGGLKDVFPQKSWNSIIQNQALIRNQLISGDHRSVLLVVEPKNLSTTLLRDLGLSIQSELKEFDESTVARVAGVPALQSHLSEMLKSELTKFLALCVLVFVGMFAVFYRRISPVVFVLVGLGVVNIIAIGFVSLFKVPFTSLLTTLPIIVSIAFASLVVHTFYYWADRLKENGAHLLPRGKRHKLALKSVRELLLANFLGGITTAIGFAALVVTPIPAIKDYAIVVSLAVMLTFAVTQVLFVLYLGYINPARRNWIDGSAAWMLYILRHAKPIFALTVVGSVALGALCFQLNFSGRLFDDLPENDSVRSNMMAIDENFGGTVSLDVAVEMPSQNAWSQPANLEKLSSALKEIRLIDGVGSASGLTDFLPLPLPKSQASAAEMFFLFSMSANDPLNQFVDQAFQKTRLAIRLRDVPSNQVDTIRGQMRQALATRFDDGVIVESGMAVNGHSINQEVAKELVYGFWQSLLIIGILLAGLFKSVRWALVACIPNLVAPAILIGVMALAQTTIKPAVGLIFSIALGLAFNNTVYLLSRLRQLQKTHGFGYLPVRRAVLEEGNPCLSESVLMFAGFLVFLSSDFQLNQVFGVYMLISIIAGGLGDLVFLPAMLKLFPRLLPLSQPRETHTSIPAKGAAAAAVAALLFSLPVFAADEAEDFLKKARKNFESKSDQAVVVLRIQEANGSEKTRKLRLKTLTEKGTFRALARVLEPADVKGTALLAEIKKDSENQWLYLPSNDQVRRVVSGKKSAGVLGSELNPADLSGEALRGAKAKVVKRDEKSVSIEITPQEGTSEYSKSILVLSLPDTLPVSNTYFVGDKERKVVTFKNYVSLAKIKRPKQISVKNLENGRGTTVEFSGMKVNARLSASDFSQAALKDDAEE